MKRSLTFPIVLFSILIFSEILSYLAIRTFFVEQKSSLRWFNWIWWLSTIILYIFLFWGRTTIESNTFKNFYFNAFMMILITKLCIGLVFFISFIFQYLQEFFVTEKSKEYIASRRSFAGKIALGLASIPFASMIYGIAKTAYDFKIHQVSHQKDNIPSAFKGFKIVQISDIHTGSLQTKHQLQKAIDLILGLKPDMIVFTGDLVNNKTDEAYEYKEILAQLSAPHGVFSTLGNHDYGDYHVWDSEKDKLKNLEEMIQLHEDLGWKLLLNEHLKIEKDNDFITLIGIENWGANLNFKKYGDLDKACEGLEKDSFQILLSHDPSHWSHQVSKDFAHIDLTLSGHTHGFQFGVEIPGFKWSPSKYIYPQWAGLYKNDDQLLYVNRGLGCLGYMGRIGIKPEITLIELG